MTSGQNLETLEPHPYDPWFTSAWKLNLTAPSFTLALMRGEIGGYIAFGGLPPTPGTISEFASAGLETMKMVDGTEQFAFYTITPDAAGLDGSMLPSVGQYVVGECFRILITQHGTLIRPILRCWHNAEL